MHLVLSLGLRRAAQLWSIKLHATCINLSYALPKYFAKFMCYCKVPGGICSNIDSGCWFEVCHNIICACLLFSYLRMKDHQ